MFKFISIGALSLITSSIPSVIHISTQINSENSINQKLNFEARRIIRHLFHLSSVQKIRDNADQYANFIFASSEYSDLLSRYPGQGYDLEEWKKYMISKLLEWGGGFANHAQLDYEQTQRLKRELESLLALEKLQELKALTEKIREIGHGILNNPEYQKYQHQINTLIASQEFTQGRIDPSHIRKFQELQRKFSQGDLHNLMENLSKQLRVTGRINIDSLNHILNIGKIINIKSMDIAQKVATWVLSAILIVIGIMLLFLFSRGIKNRKRSSKSIKILQLSLSILMIVIGMGIAASPFL